MNEFKKVLLECQRYLSAGDYERALEGIRRLSELSPKGLSEEEAREALRLIDFLISEVEKRRDELYEKLVNHQRFKNYLR
ncbi:MAG: hypothetical protein GXO04_02395 [Aquificae bacterium]|nr:hypothetical protein [Aquificota bacterium]